MHHAKGPLSAATPAVQLRATRQNSSALGDAVPATYAKICEGELRGPRTLRPSSAPRVSMPGICRATRPHQSVFRLASHAPHIKTSPCKSAALCNTTHARERAERLQALRSAFGDGGSSSCWRMAGAIHRARSELRVVNGEWPEPRAQPLPLKNAAGRSGCVAVCGGDASMYLAAECQTAVAATSR